MRTVMSKPWMKHGLPLDHLGGENTGANVGNCLNTTDRCINSTEKNRKLEQTKKLSEMGTTELKSDLHKILDRIENEQLLRTIYDFLKQREHAKEGQIWKTLTEEQKKEVYLSYEESQDDKNLIDWDTIRKKY
jgi:hypothetical protein